MQDLMEQVQIEYLPAEAAENGQPFEPQFQHHALLYIKYMQIYKKLEDCHDQMVHPQKRRTIKKVLRSTIVRILELKAQLIHFNPRTKNRFVALDEVLTDLKLNPETIEWKVPRYFLDEKECREEIEDKQHKVDHWLNLFGLSTEPDMLLDKKDPFEKGLTTDQAVAIIQKNERGRMGIQRADMVCTWRKESYRKEERQRRQAERGGKEDEDLLESQVLAATRIAAHWKRRVDRRRFLRMREEEFEFLGMSNTKHEQKESIVADVERHRERRKKMQEDADDVYENALKEQLEYLKRKKGADIKADLLEERRQWILDRCQIPDAKKQLKFPNEFDEFYQRFDKAEDEEEDPKAKGKDAKADKGKKDAKGKKDKGGAAEEDAHETGPSQVVAQFVDRINEYTEMWENRDESNNFDQRHDVELARQLVTPIVEAELRAVVDDMMREELANLKQLFAEAKKKKGKGKPKKPKKPKAPKVKKWCAAVGMVTNREDCVPDLVEQGILRKVATCNLQDFWGEYHFLGAMQRSHLPYCPPPSAQMIRSLLVEHCVLPLAQTDIRQKAPIDLAARSLLLYGPKGSGKSMLARAIAAETGATFFDLSPAVIEGKCTTGKNSSALLVYKVFICAQDMTPSVIYMDEVHQIFQAKKKGKKANTDGPDRIKKDLCAAINQVKRGPEATEQDRILFIGSTSQPFADGVDMKELMKSFDEKVWVNFPEYGSRVVLWQKFMEKHGVNVDPNKLDISTLARVSDGYSAGSIKQTVDRVLTARRVQQLKNRPLKVQEFISPLSRTNFCWQEERTKLQEFDFEVSGEKQLQAERAAEEAAKAEDAKAAKKKR
jgi:SpoVK/Ycf46/Vps4 family AAA+-type ATPase